MIHVWVNFRNNLVYLNGFNWLIYCRARAVELSGAWFLRFSAANCVKLAAAAVVGEICTRIKSKLSLIIILLSCNLCIQLKNKEINQIYCKCLTIWMTWRKYRLGWNRKNALHFLPSMFLHASTVRSAVFRSTKKILLWFFNFFRVGWIQILN